MRNNSCSGSFRFSFGGLRIMQKIKGQGNDLVWKLSVKNDLEGNMILNDAILVLMMGSVPITRGLMQSLSMDAKVILALAGVAY